MEARRPAVDGARHVWCAGEINGAAVAPASTVLDRSRGSFAFQEPETWHAPTSMDLPNRYNSLMLCKEFRSRGGVRIGADRDPGKLSTGVAYVSASRPSRRRGVRHGQVVQRHEGVGFIASDRIPTPEKANSVMVGSLAFAPARIRRELRHLVHHFHHHLGSRRLTLLI
jgi:hypothetical protein